MKCILLSWALSMNKSGWGSHRFYAIGAWHDCFRGHITDSSMFAESALATACQRTWWPHFSISPSEGAFLASHMLRVSKMTKCAQNAALQAKFCLFLCYTPKYPEVRHKCHSSGNAHWDLIETGQWNAFSYHEFFLSTKMDGVQTGSKASLHGMTVSMAALRIQACLCKVH